MSYENIPGTYVTLNDGNLPVTSIPTTEQSVLVLGTATKGLTSTPYRVGSTQSLISEFGVDSELALKVSEVQKGGATNVYAYRLPGVAPSLKNLGIMDTQGAKRGFTITPTQASPESASNYAVAYRHAYQIADSDTTITSKIVAELLVLNVKTGTIVWKGSILTGPTFDNGEVDVKFDLGDILLDEEESGGEALVLTFTGDVGADGTAIIPLAGHEISVTYSEGETDADVAQAFIDACREDHHLCNGDGEADETHPFTITLVGSAVTIRTSHDLVNADGLCVYPDGFNYEGYTIRPVLTGALPTIPGVTISPNNSMDIADIGLYPHDDSKPTAKAGGGKFVPLDKINAGGLFKPYGQTADYTWGGLLAHWNNIDSDWFDEHEHDYTVGDNGASISLMKRYERLVTAFEDLDLQSFDFIYPAGVAFNSPNLADPEIDTFTEDDQTYPTPKTANDMLLYLAVVDTGNKVYDFFWSDDQETCKLSSTGEDPESTVAYQEVNFGYLLASKCHEYTTDYGFCHGVIGTTVPTSISARGVRTYFGTAPTYTLDQDTGVYYIAEDADNGAGLLGHRLVGGRHSFNDGEKHGGLLATKDGTMDYSVGNLVLDKNGKRVDLGKYLTVVAGFGLVANSLNSRTNPYLTNVAGIVAGMLPKLPVNNSLTNKTLPATVINYRLETSTVDLACGLGLTCFKSENGVPVLADSPTMAMPTSDWTRLTTVRIVGSLVESIRSVARPFYGAGLSAPRRAALESNVNTVIKNAMAGTDSQLITAGKITLSQTAQQAVLGKMTAKLKVTPVFELRQIELDVDLSI